MPSRFDALISRQSQIAQLICLGRSVGRAVRTLGMSRKCLRRHLCLIFERTGCRSQAHLVGWAVCCGVLSVCDLQAVNGQEHIKLTLETAGLVVVLSLQALVRRTSWHK